MNFKSADLCDQFHTELMISRITFVSFGRKKRFSGPIATVQVFEDNVLIRQAIETLPTGTVLVIDGGASKRCSLLGDQLALP